ncbi:ATP-dependent DNA helicase RecG [Kordiimonas sediminis]|uniref:ATP-dependent DNA helicase RecG n=1 Tax=Kordiimonas sediminis TaxID=1735581 RepID=A0A919ATE4_9PROT|nr:ATP-dependent DNA helicase RecG [Kordiimonas sediminis]GHF25159.1 ATP-dependent DNA helicase RecG [Kordiimonas sediminis]
MRPELLYPYFADIEALPGIGKRTRAGFERAAGGRYVDLLFHLPSGVIDRRYRPTVMEAAENSIATLEVDVVQHYPAPNKRAPYKVVCRDDSGDLTLVFFHARKDWLLRQLPEGSRRLVSGKIEKYQGKVQITHPDYMVDPATPDDLPLLETLYPLSAGVSLKVLRKALLQALSEVPSLPEWNRPDLIEKENWPTFLDALKSVHQPESAADVAPEHAARRRLAYDELVATQLALAIVREESRRKKGRSLTGQGHYVDAVRALLPYQLTGDQEKAFSEIVADMQSARSMFRLVQGDVGSGKTVVALLAMAYAKDAGVQAAMLAPTEILARQHLASIASVAEQAGISVRLLTGRIKGRERAEILQGLKEGTIDILVGTHAIIQADIEFADLGLAVIDEQHRFGVQQRMALSDKGKVGVDVVGMTATPIPRTLTLTAYGDMDVSRIVEKPPGRKPIDTRVVSLERIADVAAGAKRAVTSGARVYWVCPLVEESQVTDLAAAEERFESLKTLFPERVGLVHGRMKGPDKDSVMQAFATGDLDVLVATTVIEVGVDVPEATVMVIEHAERFGLAQLHQLRGRVGRGGDKSTCILLRSNTVSEVARSRLQIMRETEDGFLIAEEDLRLRGSGEILGTRQSGLPEFRLVDFVAHSDLIEIARDDARHATSTVWFGKEGERDERRREALRHLLYLFERDEGVRMMKSG